VELDLDNGDSTSYSSLVAPASIGVGKARLPATSLLVPQGVVDRTVRQ
jgi:hypothetical protein